MSLKVTFKADRGTAAKIKEAIPSAVLEGEVCEVKVVGSGPDDVAKKARAILEKVRTVV
ncbi:MAG: hypothetical protein KGI38_06720 [Thaumarchaeota archaeon]|nr:hypothetical protein [Nitrososphaerota archaeon]